MSQSRSVVGQKMTFQVIGRFALQCVAAVDPLGQETSCSLSKLHEQVDRFANHRCGAAERALGIDQFGRDCRCDRRRNCHPVDRSGHTLGKSRGQSDLPGRFPLRGRTAVRSAARRPDLDRAVLSKTGRTARGWHRCWCCRSGQTGYQSRRSRAGAPRSSRRSTPLRYVPPCGANHDRRAVRVVGTDIDAAIAAQLLETHPDVGLDVLDQVPDVDRAVGVGQGTGDQDLTCHQFSSGVICDCRFGIVALQVDLPQGDGQDVGDFRQIAPRDENHGPGSET